MSMLKVNGVERHYPDGLPASLASLLEQLHINDATVVAEIDGDIVQRADFSTTPLEQGQAIELVRFVGGG
jgi:sulfur carrier protein